MATLYLRGVPEELVAELKAHAETDGVSVNSEALEVLAAGVARRRLHRARREALVGMDVLRERIGHTAGDSGALLREDRER